MLLVGFKPTISASERPQTYALDRAATGTGTLPDLHDISYQLPVWMILLCSLIQTCTPNGHLYRVTYTRCRIDTINSPDDGHMVSRNM